MKRGLVLAICYFLIIRQGHAEENSLLLNGGMAALLATKNEFSIEVSDQVTGGCLPQPSRLRDKLEISLRQNDFKISTENSAFSDVITITALGFKAGPGACVVHISADLAFLAVVNVPYAQDRPEGNKTFVPIIYSIASGLLTGTKGSMQSRLEEQAAQYGEMLFLEISRARDVIRDEFPEILEKAQEQSGTD